MNLQVFLCALALVESGNDDNAYNRRSGARGAFQITAKVWSQHMPKYIPHIFAHYRTDSLSASTRHYNWLRRNGVPDKPYDLAYAWHWGLTGYRRWCKTEGVSHPGFCSCHACRVERIYNDALSDSTVLKPAKKARKR